MNSLILHGLRCRNRRSNKEPVNLSVMLQQLTDEFYPLFEERQVQCRLQLKEGVMIGG